MRPTRAVVAAIVLALCAAQAGADEAAFEDAPVGTSVEDLKSPLERAIAEREREETLFPGLKRLLQRFPPVIADSAVIARMRTYALPLRNSLDETAYAWTIGGKLALRSGWIKETVQAGIGIYGSYPLVEDDPQALTQLLRPGGTSYTIVGEGFLKLRWKGVEGTIWRQELDLPYVNGSDSRMTPNSFEGVIVRGERVDLTVTGTLDWTLGWLRRMRPRFADDFVSMGAQAGALDSDAPMYLIGVQGRPTDSLLIGFYNYLVPEVLNTAYVSADWLYELPDDWGFRTQWQFTHQNSGWGDELTGKEFRTWTGGGRFGLSRGGLMGWIGFSMTNDGEEVRSPYGTSAGFLSMMLSDFNSAGETAAILGLAYDLSRVGLEGASAFMQLGMGRGAKDVALGVSGVNEWELDLTFDYKIPSGRVKGLWFRARGAVRELDAPGLKLGYQVRLIINYDLPVL